MVCPWNDSRKVINEKDLKWWNPDAAQTYKSGQVKVPSNYVLNILIDFDHDKKVIVYLLWYEL